MFNTQITNKTNIVKAVAAVALLAAPATGYAAFTLSSQSEPAGVGNMNVEAEWAEMDGKEVVETQLFEKVVKFHMTGEGHVEGMVNCSVDGDEIRFADVTRNAAIRVVADNEGDVSVADGNRVFPVGDDGTVALLASSGYGLLEIAFPEGGDAFQDAEEETSLGEPEGAWEPVEADPEPVAEWAAGEPVVTAQEPVEAVPEPVEEVVYAEPVAEAPSIEVPAHQMNEDELASAHEVFDAYNAWRAARGLATFAWDEQCANMGFWSAKGCAEQGRLVHRLGIPEDYQMQYSDILQYATWRMDGSEAVARWEGSPNHNAMMACPTATCAGVGVYNDYGCRYYAIVYGFVGSNYAAN